MAFSINDIRSQLRYEGARPNLFEVNIFNPANPIANFKTPFMCEAAELPPSQMGTVQVPYFGRILKLAGNRVFGPWTVNIINDEDFLIRNAMEEWSNTLNSREGNIRIDIGRYKSEGEVIQYSKTGDALRVYRFVGIFPADIGAITLNWGANDQYESFPVTFEYDYWEVVGGNTGSAGSGL